MLLTLQQAANMLGKTPRQVRYLIKQGKLPASKVGGQWRMDSDSLPRSSRQAQAVERKQRMLIAAVLTLLFAAGCGRPSSHESTMHEGYSSGIHTAEPMTHYTAEPMTKRRVVPSPDKPFATP